jgi:4'-phosphopantetheinyl transferase
LHWCAKETIFKICNKENINFKKNLYIEAFTPKEKGIFYGKYYTNTITENYTLNYFSINNYLVVYCYK